MAKKGVQLQDGGFKTDVLKNNQQAAKGILHVRAKTETQIDLCKAILEEKGLEVKVAKKYKPVWRI